MAVQLPQSDTRERWINSSTTHITIALAVLALLSSVASYLHLSHPPPSLATDKSSASIAKYRHLGGGPSAEFKPIQAQTEAGDRYLQGLELEELRKTIDAATQGEDLWTDIITVTDETMKARDGHSLGLRVYRTADAGAVDPAMVVYVMHGGGWTTGSHGMEEVMNRHIAVRNRAIVVSIAYRLAPEWKFPYAVEDSMDGLHWVREHAMGLGGDPTRIVVAGASAGANLAAVVARKARDEGIQGIIGQVLNIPVTCHPVLFPRGEYEYTSWEQNKEASCLSAHRMHWYWGLYQPTKEPDPDASPLLADNFSGLPPALLQIAGFDPLRDEGLAYADKLKAAGVPITIEVYAGLPHGFASLPMIESPQQYYNNIVYWLRRLEEPVTRLFDSTG